MSTARPPLPDSYEGLWNRARTLYGSGNTEAALELYRRLVGKLGRLSDHVLARRPELGDMHLQTGVEMAELFRREGRFAEAIEAMEGLLQSHPDQADTLRRDLAILRLSRGETAAGLAELRTMAEEEPDDPLKWLVLGNESRIEGRLVESQAVLDRALEVAKQNQSDDLDRVYYHRFLLFKDMGRLEDAVAAWEQAVALNAETGDSIREVYTMLADAGRYGEALQYVARDENQLQAGFQRGLVASLTGDPARANREWRAVAGLDPGDFDSGHDCWVEAVLRLGDPDPALEELQELLPQYGTPRLLVLSGIGWAMREDAELAAALFQRAINLRRWGRPPKQKLDSADWRLLDSLVAEDEIKSPLKSYFAVIESLWG